MYTNRRNFCIFKEIGVEEHDGIVTPDFKPEVEIRPFHACTMKNMQYNPYLWPNHRNFLFLHISVMFYSFDFFRFSVLCRF